MHCGPAAAEEGRCYRQKEGEPERDRREREEVFL